MTWGRGGWRAWALAWLAAIAMVSAATARAQDTGGSIGGGDWGDEGGGSDWGSSGSSGSDWGSSSGSGSDWGSSGSSGSDWGSSGSTDWGSPSSGSSSSTSSDWYGSGSSSPSYDSSGPYASGYAAEPHGRDDFFGSMVLVFIFLVFVLMLAGFAVLARNVVHAEQTLENGGKGLTFAPRPSAAAMGYLDVSRLQLVVDWRARKFVQNELARLAKEASPSTPQGRAEILHAVSRALATVQLAWLYAGARNFSPMPKAEAQQRFQSLANDARAGYRQEVVRATDRVVTVDAVGVRAKESEGAGVVLVTVIVAARREIFDFSAERAGDIATLLRQLEALDAANLVAIEVVWTPAVEEDRMSTAELEGKYPGLVKIGGIGGRVFCGYCGGPHAAELANCPHCGAPGGEPQR